jgi:hypothetical protein
VWTVELGTETCLHADCGGKLRPVTGSIRPTKTKIGIPAVVRIPSTRGTVSGAPLTGPEQEKLRQLREEQRAALAEVVASSDVQKGEEQRRSMVGTYHRPDNHRHSRVIPAVKPFGEEKTSSTRRSPLVIPVENDREGLSVGAALILAIALVGFLLFFFSFLPK